jgi:hypothetical protein
MCTLYSSAFLKKTLEKLLQFKLLPKIEYKSILEMKVSRFPKQLFLIPGNQLFNKRIDLRAQAQNII